MFNLYYGNFMKHITCNFFVKNKPLIGVEMQPRDILNLTKDYIERKQKLIQKIKENGFEIKTNNKHVFWSIVTYYSKLKRKGIDDSEKSIGQNGLDLMGQNINLFGVDL